ncbi:MAG: branched-chain amino acid ABC transporter permease [Iamia sp.]
MDFNLFIQFVLNGIGNGAVYGSIALALVLIFRSTGLLNLAQGEMALFSTYFAWWLTSQGLSIFVAIPITIVVSMAGGAVIERMLIRPVSGEGKSPLNVLIVMLGMFLAFNALAQLIFSDTAEPMPKPWPTNSSPGDPVGRSQVVELADIRISWSVIALVIALLIECLILYVLFQRTTVGLKLRAVASNAGSARLVGINSSAMLMLGWALAAGLGALAGTLVAADRGSVSPGLMVVVVVFAFSGAALGGFDSPVGAVVGGMIVAIAEALTIGYVDFLSGIELVVPFGIILLVLLVRPTGLFGRKVVERV